jgi:phage gp36-like protein
MPTPYITLSDFSSLYGADDVALIAQTGADLEAVIAAVCAEADAYVLSAAIAPVSAAIIQVVRFAVADLARFRAYNQAASEVVRQRAEDALKFLRAIARKEIVLPAVADDPNTEEDEAATGSVRAASPRMMGREFDGGW